MTERESSEIEKVLLYISDARTRARRAAELVEKEGGGAHILAALQDSAKQLDELHRRLAQGTYYAVDESTMKLAV
jgi:hypothetical protein